MFFLKTLESDFTLNKDYYKLSSMNISFRPLTVNDTKSHQNLLCEALFVRKREAPFSKTIINTPDLKKYYAN